MRAQVPLQKSDSHFINCMKYFTMPFGYNVEDILPLKSKFETVSYFETKKTK